LSAGGEMFYKFKSIVYSLIGLLLPFTVTRSIFLQNPCIPGVKTSYKSSLISKSTPNCLVAAYNLEAILTFGLK
jgi:hypothetical protein